jgi:histidinol-phosphatase (PHP family)
VFDYHVHSEFSADCTAPMRDSCEAAIAAGVIQIAFTDHVEHQHTDLGYGYYRFEQYLESVEHAQIEFAGRLKVLKGAEVDFHLDTAEAVERFMNQYGREYDFIIGSVHYGHGAQIIFTEYFDGKTVDEVVLPYFDQIEAAIRTGWFDTIGHLDIPKRYLPASEFWEPSIYRDRLQSVFRTLIEADMAFEINTSGIRQRPKASMPGPATVAWYVEAGGRLITTGTDSHAAQTVGAGLPETLAMLSLCGISDIASFDGRQRTLVPIASLLPAVAAV